MRPLLLLLLCALPARSQLRFEEPFVFGLASAPGHAEDKLDDIWLDWARAGKTVAYWREGQPERRLDFWTRPEIELDLAAKTGIQVYRLGVDWGRIMPAPRVFDETAIVRYRAILKMVKKRKMKVMLTLMHHSVPKWAQERGGWLDDGMKDDYLEFSRRVIDELGPDVDYWITFNEANVFAPLAYTVGFWPPGRKSSALSLLAVGPFKGSTVAAMDRMSGAHNALYDWAHAKYPGIKMGIAHNMAWYASKGALGKISAMLTGELMNWRFPERIRGRMDFFGFNYYGAEWIKGRRLDIDPAEEYSEAGRAIYPEGLYLTIKEVARRFPGAPILVTENGIADATDVLRPAYLLEHLAAIAKARAEGAPVQGYFFWTLSDNLEWADGYCPKFGLVAVDRARGLRRTPRASYALFKKVVSTREITPEMRRAAWEKAAGSAGAERPFCRAADGMTPLDEPATRRLVAKDWRFGL